LSNLEVLSLSSNDLCGEIPPELKNLSAMPLSGIFSLDNNHLTASDSELITWLDNRTPGWESTQTPCPPQIDLENKNNRAKNTYNSGDHFLAQLTEKSDWGYDLYIALVMPDGNFFALKNTNELGALNTPVQWNGERVVESPVVLLDLNLPDNLLSGEYCLYGILSPENESVFDTIDLWGWTVRCFEYN